MLYLFLIIGILVHLILKRRNAYTEKTQFDWQRHIIITLFNLPVGLFIVFLYENELTPATAAFIGYALDSVIKNIENYSWKKIGKN